MLYGVLAHLVERLPCTQEVIGSSPIHSTTIGDKYSQMLERMVT